MFIISIYCASQIILLINQSQQGINIYDALIVYTVYSVRIKQLVTRNLTRTYTL